MGKVKGDDLRKRRKLQRTRDPGDHCDKDSKQILKEEGSQGHVLQKTGKDLKTSYWFSHLEASEDCGTCASMNW